MEQVAARLSNLLGRKITHLRLSSSEFEDRLMSRGLSKETAQMLAALDATVAQGAEERLNDVVLRVTGSAPMRFEDWAKDMKEVGWW